MMMMIMAGGIHAGERANEQTVGRLVGRCRKKSSAREKKGNANEINDKTIVC